MIAYYLNLADRKDRQQRFLDANGYLFDCVRVPAIAGTPAFTHHARSIGLLSHDAKCYADTCVATAAGVRRMWQLAAKRPEPVICCADDALFNGEAPKHLNRMLASLPADWDIIELAPTLTNYMQFEVVPGWLEARVQWSQPLSPKWDLEFTERVIYPQLYKLRLCLGGTATIVNPRSVARLLALTFPLDDRPRVIPGWLEVYPPDAPDNVIAEHYHRLSAFVSFPPLAMATQYAMDSSVKPSSPFYVGRPVSSK